MELIINHLNNRGEVCQIKHPNVHYLCPENDEDGDAVFTYGFIRDGRRHIAQCFDAISYRLDTTA